MKRMNRSTLADVCKVAGIGLDQGECLVRAILMDLALGREVRLAGLGIFKASVVSARMVRSAMIPGGMAQVLEHRVIRFRRDRSSREVIQ